MTSVDSNFNFQCGRPHGAGPPPPPPPRPTPPPPPPRGGQKKDVFLYKKKKINKLESNSRISALGPVGHCTSHFKRAVCISCRPRVDVHKGVGGSGPCGRGGQKRDILVDVINGWPLT